nr:MAG TPA: hypothetical protein [Caudoviricetes sp.]
MEYYIFICLLFLVSTLINVTVAGWLAVKMGEFMWKKIEKL